MPYYTVLCALDYEKPVRRYKLFVSKKVGIWCDLKTGGVLEIITKNTALQIVLQEHILEQFYDKGLLPTKTDLYQGIIKRQVRHEQCMNQIRKRDC